MLGALTSAALAATSARPAVAADFEALFAASARLWPRWSGADRESRIAVDHGAWSGWLATYLRVWPDGTMRVAYADVAAADRGGLRDYLGRLAMVPVGKLRRAEQFAFWVNLYNALTVDVVLAAYPVRSIRDIDISPGLFARGPWDKKLIKIEGEAVTLNDIEHRILRPIWRDARVHYALNCAAIGCPNLQPAAFTAAASESMLERAARAYVNHPRGARPDGDGLALSKLYSWYEEDFGGEAGVIAHLARYAEPKLAEAIRRAPRIESYQYDWSLNDAR